MDNTIDYISADTAQTLDGLFRARVQQSSNKIAYRRYLRDAKLWQDLTWSEMAEIVAHWQHSIESLELKAGDKIAILLRNCPEWVAIEHAALGLGLVVVPLYVDDRPDNAAYILQNADIKALFVQEVSKWQQIKEAEPSCIANIKGVIVIDDNPSFITTDPDDNIIFYANNWLSKEPAELQQRQGKPDDLATIVYTSGTTGKPKGVMLSHRNILFDAEAALKTFDLKPDQLFLSFLPLSHMFERTVGYYIPMMCDGVVAYSRSIQSLADDMITLKPNVLVAVPRIFERIYDKIYQNLKKQSPVKRMLFNRTIAIGWHRFLMQQGKVGWKPSQALWPMLNKLVACKLRQRLGGELALIASGGAALPPTVAKVFISMGLNIIQGYGLTETSPIISGNTAEKNDPSSVGMPLPGIKISTDDNNQLLVKSPANMLGYWNNETATNEIINPDGWLQTGDIVKIENEHIYITGRSKDILVLSNGEKVPPSDMESAITIHPYFEQALIIGEGRSYLSALIVLNPDTIKELAQKFKIDEKSSDDFQSRTVQSLLLKQISLQLRDFPGYAKIRRITVLLEPWTIDNGMMTPTLKIKRAIVLNNFDSQITAMY
ncbi:Long-chain-fatty-acid--CoA ligase [hydrothermal vent metagenome]|uniref:Long-chain-fatty-acid--CoA ligase n=1 Tax=hydrothermal vent metagenome TaxID=652676 RepID=A0A3B1ACL9_9ZZZZ